MQTCRIFVIPSLLFWCLLLSMSACQTSTPAMLEPSLGQLEVQSMPTAGGKTEPAVGGKTLSTAPAASEGVAGRLALSAEEQKKFGCRRNEDCSSTCDSGCVSLDFAAKHQDTCVNIRAFDCSCVQNVCNTDGRAPQLTR